LLPVLYRPTLTFTRTDRHLFVIVMRGLVPRIYPVWRPDAVTAPGRAGPRHEAAGDVR
jgi:hypothetical protein